LGLLEEQTVHGARGKDIIGSRGGGEDGRVHLNLCLVRFLDLNWMPVQGDHWREEAGEERKQSEGPEYMDHGDSDSDNSQIRQSEPYPAITRAKEYAEEWEVRKLQDERIK